MGEEILRRDRSRGRRIEDTEIGGGSRDQLSEERLVEETSCRLGVDPEKIGNHRKAEPGIPPPAAESEEGRPQGSEHGRGHPVCPEPHTTPVRRRILEIESSDPVVRVGFRVVNDDRATLRQRLPITAPEVDAVDGEGALVHETVAFETLHRARVVDHLGHPQIERVLGDVDVAAHALESAFGGGREGRVIDGEAGVETEHSTNPGVPPVDIEECEVFVEALHRAFVTVAVADLVAQDGRPTRALHRPGDELETALDS